MAKKVKQLNKDDGKVEDISGKHSVDHVVDAHTEYLTAVLAKCSM